MRALLERVVSTWKGALLNCERIRAQQRERRTCVVASRGAAIAAARVSSAARAECLRRQLPLAYMPTCRPPKGESP